jgi:hypothetical protein
MRFRTCKVELCLLVIFLLVAVAGDFVTQSISDQLTVQIRDTQQLIAQEQEKVEEQNKAQEQTPAAVTVTYLPSGTKLMTVTCGVNINLEVDLSGEIIRNLSLKLVDLQTAKNLWDLWNSYFDAILEAWAMLILGTAMGLGLKRRRL